MAMTEEELKAFVLEKYGPKATWNDETRDEVTRGFAKWRKSQSSGEGGFSMPEAVTPTPEQLDYDYLGSPEGAVWLQTKPEYEQRAILATEKAKQEPGYGQPPAEKGLLERATDYMIPEQAQKFMSEMAQQVTDPYARLQERRHRADVQHYGAGKNIEVSFPEKMQNMFTGHLTKTKRSANTPSIAEYPGIERAKTKTALLLGTGASNAELVRALSADESLGMEMLEEDGRFYIRDKGTEQWYEADPKVELHDVLGFGAELATLAGLGRFFPGGAAGIRAAMLRGLGEESILQTIQSAAGGSFDEMDIAFSTLGSGAAKSAAGLFQFGKQLTEGVGDYRKLLTGSIEGDATAQGKIKDILSNGTDRQKTSLKGAMDDLELQANPQGVVSSKAIDPVSGIRASAQMDDSSLLSRSFPKDEELIEEMNTQGWGQYAVPSILVKRAGDTANRIADLSESPAFRKTQLKRLVDDVTSRLSKSEEGLGAKTAGWADEITNELLSLEKSQGAHYDKMYKELGGDFEIDASDVLKQIKDLVSKRGFKTPKKGFKFVKKPKDKMSKFEKMVVNTLTPAKTVKETVSKKTDPYLGTTEETVKEFGEAKATFRELEWLRQLAGDMLQDQQFTSTQKGIANKIYAITKTKQQDALANAPNVRGDFLDEFNKLSDSVRDRKMMEADTTSLFGKSLQRDLVAFTRTALSDLKNEGQELFMKRVTSLPQGKRAPYLREALLYTLGKVDPESGLHSFADVWRGIEKSKKIRNMMKIELGSEYDMYSSLGKVSQAVQESYKNKLRDGYTKEQVDNAINAKHGVFKGLVNDLAIAIGGSQVFQVLQKTPGLGGTGTLALSTGILNTGRKLSQNLNEDQMIRFSKVFNSEEFVDLMRSDLKDTDYQKFMKSSPMRLFSNQLKRVGDTRPIEEVVMSWTRTGLGKEDAPDVIDPKENK